MVLNKSNVLLLMEKSAMSESLKMVLEKVFRNVYFASGIDSLAIAKEKRIDIVLASNRINEMCNYDKVLEQIIDEYGKDIPKIFMTDDITSNTLLTIQKFNPIHITLFPIDVKDLISRIYNV
jgi:DNA-binding NtrC family response regulator